MDSWIPETKAGIYGRCGSPVSCSGSCHPLSSLPSPFLPSWQLLLFNFSTHLLLIPHQPQYLTSSLPSTHLQIVFSAFGIDTWLHHLEHFSGYSPHVHVNPLSLTPLPEMQTCIINDCVCFIFSSGSYLHNFHNSSLNISFLQSSTVNDCFSFACCHIVFSV